MHFEPCHFFNWRWRHWQYFYGQKKILGKISNGQWCLNHLRSLWRNSLADFSRSNEEWGVCLLNFPKFLSPYSLISNPTLIRFLAAAKQDRSSRQYSCSCSCSRSSQTFKPFWVHQSFLESFWGSLGFLRVP